MKKLIAILLVLLLGTNIYLAAEVKKLKSVENKNIIKEVIETDITKVVDAVEDKVVSVINYNNNRQIGSGSGVIYKVEGDTVYIITNHHVIDGGNNVEVSFSSGESVKARVIGSDTYSDLALLELKSKNRTPFKLGDSSSIKVGEFVLAMGSPLGIEFANSTTLGIISGKERSLAVDVSGDGRADWDMKVIQTDAAINPGNSGGSLVNTRGELIGINSLKISKSEVEGMGFAIPINEVIPIIEQIEKEGSVRYPIVGISSVSIEDMNDYQKEYYSIGDVEYGIFIAEVIKGSPAEKGGILAGDIITRFDGTEVKAFKEFRKILYGKRPGDTVVFEVLRDDKTVSIEVTLD
jgi:serine protease Do